MIYDNYTAIDIYIYSIIGIKLILKYTCMIYGIYDCYVYQTNVCLVLILVVIYLVYTKRNKYIYIYTYEPIFCWLYCSPIANNEPGFFSTSPRLGMDMCMYIHVYKMVHLRHVSWFTNHKNDKFMVLYLESMVIFQKLLLVGGFNPSEKY